MQKTIKRILEMYYYNFNGNTPKKDNNNNNRPTGISWALIIFLFLIGLYPIALIALIWKLFAPSSSQKTSVYRTAPSLSEQEAKRQAAERAQAAEKERQKEEAKEKIKALFDTPKPGKVPSILLMGFGGAVALFSLMAMTGLGTEAALGTTLFLISTTIAGGAMLYSGIQMRGALKRYENYAAIIGGNTAVDIENLAGKTGYSKKRVEKDLQQLCENGYFGKTAYVNHELGYLFMSSEADEELAEAKRAALEKTAEAAKAEAARQNASVYDQILFQIRDVNERIPGQEMSEKIYEIEDITAKIFAEVEKEPKKRGKIDRFMSYYLPTTLKLLEHYATLESTKVEGENIVKSKQSIENAMDSIVEGFKRQLDELYKTDNLDIESDIDVLVQMMDRDKAKSESGFKKSVEKTGSGEINLGGSAAQTK